MGIGRIKNATLLVVASGMTDAMVGLMTVTAGRTLAGSLMNYATM